MLVLGTCVPVTRQEQPCSDHQRTGLCVCPFSNLKIAPLGVLGYVRVPLSCVSKEECCLYTYLLPIWIDIKALQPL